MIRQRRKAARKKLNRMALERGIELGAEDRTDLPHPGKVHRAAVDVDDTFEQGYRCVVVRIDELNDLPLRRGQMRVRGRGSAEECKGND